MNREEAIKATKYGAIVACISGATTLSFTLYAIFSNNVNSFELWNDSSTFYDILLIFGCAFGIYKKSRFASVTLFVYFILSKILISIETGGFSGIYIGAVILYFYGKAIQGAFVFHKIEKVENPQYKSTPKWMLFTGIPAILIILVIMGFGIFSMTGLVPSAEVQSGAEMPLKDKNSLISNNIIRSNDTVLHFYSSGLFDILEGGSVLTKDRVILYMNDENQEMEIYELYFNEITSVKLIQKGNALNDFIYRIEGNQSNSWLQIALPASNYGQVEFIETLRSKIKK